MNMRVAQWLACLLLAGFVAPAFAQAQVRAWLDRDRIEMGETATLNVETDQSDAQSPDFDLLVPDFVVSGHSSRRGYEVSGGQRRSRVLFAVALSPRREGVTTIPALRIGNARTSPLTLTVLPATAAPARAGAPAFIESEVDSREPYVQQSVGYVLRLYYATPLVSGQLDQPVPDGALMQKIGGDVQYTRDVAGQRYTVVERRYQVVPERSGLLTIPGARFSGRGVGGYFDDLFGGGRRDLAANGPSHALQVKSMPRGATQPWLPLHGLELRYVAAPDAARVGEAAVVVVEAMADGAAGTQIPELQLQVGAGAQVFAEPPQVDETFDNGRLRTRVVRRFSVVPAHEGALHIPGVRLGWWDVNAGIARTASLPDLQWRVAAGAVDDAGMQPMAVAATAGASVGWWKWLAGLFALLWLATLAWMFRNHAVFRRLRKPMEQSSPAVAGHHPASITSRQWLQLLQAGDLGEVADALCAMTRPATSDLDALSQRLDDAGQRHAVASLQRARWGDGDPAEARALLRDAFADGVKLKPTASPNDGTLPPLYPRRPSL
ncbi:MAG: BatD family protein [Luteimonas sp.]|nr:BatD family protein [Luteimonas sp.]